MEVSKTTSVAVSETSKTVNSVLQVLDQKVMDEFSNSIFLARYPKSSGYLIGFSANLAETYKCVPYYEIIDLSDDKKIIPHLFETQALVNQYYGTDATLMEQNFYKGIFDTHPVLAKSAEAYPVNACKIVVKWTGENFYNSLSNPTEVTNEAIIKQVSYIGVYNSQSYLDRKAFARLKTFLEIAAHCNYILVGLKRMPISITIDRTEVSDYLNESQIILNDIPSIFYNGIYHSVSAFKDAVNAMFIRVAEDEAFRVGRQVTEELERLDLLCKGFVNIDQFSAYLMNNALDRIRANRFQINAYIEYAMCNFPESYTNIVMDTRSNQFIYFYQPTAADWDFCLFYIMIDIGAREKMIALFQEIVAARGLFVHISNEFRIREIFKTRVDQKLLDPLVNYFNTAFAGGSEKMGPEILSLEFFARFIKIKVNCDEITESHLDFIRFYEIFLAFMTTPKIAWYNADQYGHILFNLLYRFCPGELAVWINEVGLFVQHDGNQYIPVQFEPHAYDNEALRNGIYYSFLAPVLPHNRTIHATPFISGLYRLLCPAGQQVNLNRKAAAHYPYMHQNFVGYVPWSIIDYRNIALQNPINMKLIGFSGLINGLISRYLRVQDSKNATKESYVAIISVLGEIIKSLSVLLHGTYAKQYRTLMDSFLYVIDGFDGNNPHIVPQHLGYSGYLMYNVPQNQRNLLGQAAVISLSRYTLNTKIFIYIATSLQGVLRTDCIGLSGEKYTFNMNDNSEVRIGPLNGSKITQFSLDVLNQSKRINECFALFNLMHNNYQGQILRTVRDRLRRFWSSTNAGHIMDIIAKEFNCPITEYFRLESMSGTFLMNPKVYRPTLFYVTLGGTIVDDQPNGEGVNVAYEYGDAWTRNSWTLLSHLLFSDETPIFRQIRGLVLGYFSLAQNSPADFYDINGPGFLNIDLDVPIQVFNTAGNLGYRVVFSILVGGQRLDFNDPNDPNIPPIRFLKDRLGTLHKIYIDFIKKMLLTRRHHFVLRDLIVDYNIVTAAEWNDVQNIPSVIDKVLEGKDSQVIGLQFYDTRFIEEHMHTRLISPYLEITYRNIVQLRDDTIAGGIFGNPNQAHQRLVALELDNFGFGEVDGLTSRFPEHGGLKTQGTRVNFNNHVDYITNNVSIRLPEIVVQPSEEI
uniref:Nonstructural protein n=1 Tax=Physostegia virginiana fijivirus TaxID=3075966 RepID=A0AA95Z1Z8_9REOV|nr:nonstructural protein [Physostegia virginiana fijivirus]